MDALLAISDSLTKLRFNIPLDTKRAILKMPSLSFDFTVIDLLYSLTTSSWH